MNQRARATALSCPTSSRQAARTAAMLGTFFGSKPIVSSRSEAGAAARRAIALAKPTPLGLQLGLPLCPAADGASLLRARLPSDAPEDVHRPAERSLAFSVVRNSEMRSILAVSL